MIGLISLPVNIQDDCLYFIGKIKHNNFYEPVELIVYKNTVGDVSVSITDMGEYRLISADGKFLPNKTWVANPVAKSKDVNAQATDGEGFVIEFNVKDNIDLNGYMDIRVEVYP